MSGTSPVFALKIPHLWKPLSFRQTETVGLYERTSIYGQGFPACEHVLGLRSLKSSQPVSFFSFCSSKATELCTAAITAVALLSLMVGKWELRTGKRPDVSTATALLEVVNFYFDYLSWMLKKIHSNCQCDLTHKTSATENQCRIKCCLTINQ